MNFYCDCTTALMYFSTYDLRRDTMIKRKSRRVSHYVCDTYWHLCVIFTRFVSVSVNPSHRSVTHRFLGFCRIASP